MDVRVGREAGGEHRNEGEARTRAHGQGQIWAHATWELALHSAAAHAHLARRGGATRGGWVATNPARRGQGHGTPGGRPTKGAPDGAAGTQLPGRSAQPTQALGAVT